MLPIRLIFAVKDCIRLLYIECFLDIILYIALYASIPLIIEDTNDLRSAGLLSANPLSSEDSWLNAKKLESKLNKE